MSKKKILWFLGWPNGLNSGVAIYSLLFIQHLLKQGWPIRIVTGPQNLFLFKLYRITILPIWVLWNSLKGNFIIVLDDFFSYLGPFSLKRLVVITHHLRSGDESLKTTRKKNRLMIDKIFKTFASFSYKVICVSEYTRIGMEEYIPYSKDKLITIYNTIDLAKFSQKGEPVESLFTKYKIRYSKNTKYLLYVGTEEWRKNFQVLLHALGSLKEESICLIKLGDAVYSDNRTLHLDIIQELGLQDRVYFIDRVPMQDLISFYQNADLYVNPSLFEGFGRTPVEAQAAGCPVLSTKCGALQDVLHDSCPLIEDPLSVEEWTQKIKETLSQDRSYWIEKGYENANRFAIEKVSLEWEQIFYEIGLTKQPQSTVK